MSSLDETIAAVVPELPDRAGALQILLRRRPTPPPTLTQALSNVLNAALRLIPAQHVAAYLRSDADGEFHSVATANGAGPLTSSLNHVCAVPITLGGERIGFLSARNDHPFTADAMERLATCAISAALAVENQHARSQDARIAERRRLLDQISRHLHQTLDLSELIARLFAEVNLAIEAEAQSIWLVDNDAGVIACLYATGPGAEQVTQVAVPLGEGIVGNTVARQESLLIADAQQDSRHSRRAQQRTGIVTRSLMSVPLVRNGRAIGAMQAINKRPETVDAAPFSPADLELFRSIADIAALCIENARLYADLEDSYDTTLAALSAALDTRDHETEGHSLRVVEYTARLAEEIGLGGEDLRVIRRGALIHDIGKIGVPDAILNKPGPLTPEEQRVMAKHPEVGFAMLRGISQLRREVQIVLTHHERWDGGGYPYGLRNEEIPLEARLFAIADTFDAITSDRPYRKARSYEVAAEIIAAEAGRQFDPEIVAAFLRISQAEWTAIRERVAPAVPSLPTTLPGETPPRPLRISLPQDHFRAVAA